MKRRFFALFPVLYLVVLGLAIGQALPDAGSLQPQFKHDGEATKPRPISPVARVAPVVPQQPGAKVIVKYFQFSGNHLLSTDQLLSAVENYRNRPLDFAQLQDAVGAVVAAYRAAGWLARVQLPEQEIKDGIVSIAVLEASFGKVIVAETSANIDTQRVLGYFGRRQQGGEPINIVALDRALLLADDLPGVIVSGAFRPGEKYQETDIVLQVTKEPAFQAVATLDNAGTSSTGQNRIIAGLSWSNPTQLGDQLVANAMQTRGSDYLQLAHTLALGSNGWRVGWNASQFSYRLVSTAFAALNVQGTDATFGVEASYPLIRTRSKNLYVNMAYGRKHLHNEANATVTSDYLTESFSVYLAGNYFVRQGNASNALLSLMSGHVNLDGSPNQSTDAVTGSTHGNFSKVRYSFAHQQFITTGTAALATVSGQWANTNLDSSEKFYLGGLQGVRAYPTNEGSGSTGQIVSLELRHSLLPQLSSTIFYDWGRVTQNVNNNFAGSASPNRFQLAGGGLGLDWTISSRMHLQGVWARRIHNNPNATIAGTDQDGSSHLNRWWLVATASY